MAIRLDPLPPPPPPRSERADYWDNPDSPDVFNPLAPFDSAPLPPNGDEAQSPRLAAGPRIDGTDVGTTAASGQTPDGKPIQIGQLLRGEQVNIVRERTIADAGNGRTFVSSDQVVLTTGQGRNDNVQITQRDDGTLDAVVNGESFEIRLAQGQELAIRVGDGNDVINVAANVKVNIVVDGGAGDDNITTGAGKDRIDGGTGNDTISSGASRDDVFGNSGNDRLDAGAGKDVVHGGDGDDIMFGGDGDDFMEGGKGSDTLNGDAGNDILSGGLDADTLRGGAGNDSVHTGRGNDIVENTGGNDTIHAQQASDTISAATGASNTVINVEISNAKGVTVEGSDSFRQRVEAEIEFLRSSASGQQMLAELDKAAAGKGNTVIIRELSNEQNGFAQTFSNDADIVNGRPGKGGDVVINFNPSFHLDAFPVPVAVLYHEMSHAYNGVNGTFQSGTFTGAGPDGGQVPNAERQAVGLENSAPAFDFDGDPRTPRTTANPIALTENGLRRELGLPDRLNYTLPPGSFDN